MSEEVKETQTEQVTEQSTAAEPENKPEVQTVTMSQDELNALISREKGRVKNKYSDYDELKEQLSAYEKEKKEREEAEMTELELLKKQLSEKDEASQTLAQQLEEEKKARESEKIRNEFIKVATSNDIAYIDDAIALADLSAVKVEDGKVVGVEDVVKTLVDNKPFLVKKKAPKPIGQSSNGDAAGASEKTAEQLLKEAAERAKHSGRPEDKVAYAKLKRELSK
ncbi:phage scaffolding protein [Bacillus swezeyi]|uniref:phage scaffolding protein n=1 Tax=Bacillus swezeyi TaxID=1925020 RepID=UPI003F89E02D